MWSIVHYIHCTLSSCSYNLYTAAASSLSATAAAAAIRLQHSAPSTAASAGTSVAEAAGTPLYTMRASCPNVTQGGYYKGIRGSLKGSCIQWACFWAYSYAATVQKPELKPREAAEAAAAEDSPRLPRPPDMADMPCTGGPDMKPPAMEEPCIWPPYM